MMSAAHNRAIDGIMAILTADLPTSHLPPPLPRGMGRMFRPRPAGLAPLGEPPKRKTKQRSSKVKQHRLYPTTEVILRMLRAAAERGEQVTIRQLGEAAGLSSSSTVASHLFKLEALELAQRDRAGRWSAANVAPPDERCRNHLRAALEALADVESEQVFAARESLEAALAIVEARA